MDFQFNLTIPEHAYIFGLLQTDGNLRETTRNRSQISLELSAKDKDILYKIYDYLPFKTNISNRTRNTNFSQNYNSFTLRICNYNIKEQLKSLGLPSGAKSKIVSPPALLFSEKDYYRGIIDGDGSLGFTNANLPFISFVTQSEFLAYGFISLVEKICNTKKSCNRNKRDNVFNISLFREHAQVLVKFLYEDNVMSINRKNELSKKVMQWQRPSGMKKNTALRWTPIEDEYILSHSINECLLNLKRNINGIKTRLKRLQSSE